jgi:hypothetical protein
MVDKPSVSQTSSLNLLAFNSGGNVIITSRQNLCLLPSVAVMMFNTVYYPNRISKLMYCCTVQLRRNIHEI